MYLDMIPGSVILKSSLSVHIILFQYMLRVVVVLISHFYSGLYASKKKKNGQKNKQKSSPRAKWNTAVTSVDLGTCFIAQTHTIHIFYFCMGKKSLIFYLLQLHLIFCSSSRKSTFLTSFSTVQSVSPKPLCCKHRLTVTPDISNLPFSGSQGLCLHVQQALTILFMLHSRATQNVNYLLLVI